MLRANCFTTVVTQATARRLEDAATNRRPISRREREKGAVVAVQTALASLNNGYMIGAEIDGAFGTRTALAVEAFQRDYALVADGVVGRQVLEQLDEIYAGESARRPVGVSVHIGVDRVDPSHYGGPLTLPSCVNDAREMERIADGLGYTTMRMENEAATTQAFTAFMRNVALNAFAGDSVLVSFSGHGSQVPNHSADDEPDGRDETLCFYDRMLIDDELHGLLVEFREGVRVHVVFDSCHSGTAFKMLVADGDTVIDVQKAAYKDDVAVQMKAPLVPIHPTLGMGEDDRAADMLRPITAKSLVAAMDGDGADLEAPSALPEGLADKTAELFADLMVNGLSGTPKFVDGLQFYEKNQPVYDAVRTAVGSKERHEMACTLTAFAAADDSQTTPAGNPLSLFTYNISQTWANGGFDGSYTQFHRAVRSRSRPDATPQLTPDGSMGAAARLRERPFGL